MKIFYFTATGNSLYVAKRIGGELYSIPQMLKKGKSKFEDEAIGLVFPCYAFGLPRIVIDFLQKSKLKAKYFFAIMTYGNMAASGLRHLEEVGSKAGIQFNYTNEVLMIDNYLPLFKIEDQLKKESSKKIEEKLDQIVSDISNRQKKLTRKGFASDVFSKPIYNLNSKFQYDTGDKRLIVQDNCNSCKICEKVCPRNNIKLERKPEFLHKCEGCYACIHHCPQNAIHLKFERSKARFINQNVKLKEIIDSNNQGIS
ncbi:EFR1 family ferrodoxin [Sporomusa sp.]|uniref:EFR1 family ferrodoxin n=1 Tax=Sporomusa sp. TaxID=2078658 RepID=UPI002BB923C6|nr:EFR1 family ferrodoxin [Sporomusa sp.]HWR42121.1 EFR1 family ferrodoxin [Sporomusa sp.]